MKKRFSLYIYHSKYSTKRFHIQRKQVHKIFDKNYCITIINPNWNSKQRSNLIIFQISSFKYFFPTPQYRIHASNKNFIPNTSNGLLLPDALVLRKTWNPWFPNLKPSAFARSYGLFVIWIRSQGVARETH